MVDWISIDLKGWLWVAILWIFGALMTTPRSAATSAVLESWTFACEIEDSSKTMSSAKSRSFND